MHPPSSTLRRLSYHSGTATNAKRGCKEHPPKKNKYVNKKKSITFTNSDEKYSKMLGKVHLQTRRSLCSNYPQKILCHSLFQCPSCKHTDFLPLLFGFCLFTIQLLETRLSLVKCSLHGYNQIGLQSTV